MIVTPRQLPLAVVLQQTLLFAARRDAVLTAEAQLLYDAPPQTYLHLRYSVLPDASEHTHEVIPA